MAKSSSEHDELIFKIALLGAGYFLVVRPILEKVGLEKSAEQVATETKNKDILNTQVQAATKAQQPTKSIAEWKVIADQIYADLRSGTWSSQKECDDAAYQICRVKNDADFWLLFKYFAKRREYLMGIPNSPLQNLEQFVKISLSAKKIDAINKNFSTKPMKFRF